MTKKVALVDPLDVLRDLVRHHGSQKAVARHLNISEPFLSDVMNRRRDVSDRLVEKLGLCTVYAKAERAS